MQNSYDGRWAVMVALRDLGRQRGTAKVKMTELNKRLNVRSIQCYIVQPAPDTYPLWVNLDSARDSRQQDRSLTDWYYNHQERLATTMVYGQFIPKGLVVDSRRLARAITKRQESPIGVNNLIEKAGLL